MDKRKAKNDLNRVDQDTEVRGAKTYKLLIRRAMHKNSAVDDQYCRYMDTLLESRLLRDDVIIASMRQVGADNLTRQQ